MSASFQFYEFKEGNKKSVWLVQRQVQTHMFYKSKRRGLFPKMGLSMFNLMSPMKENVVLFMFRESERPHKNTPKGLFSYDLVPKARKSIKSYLRTLLGMIGWSVPFS